MINSLRDTVSESTFVFYSSSVQPGLQVWTWVQKGKESQINQILTQFFFQKILSTDNHNITRDNYNSSIQNDFQ